MLNFVDNYQVIGMSGQEQFGIVQLEQVGLNFQIEIDCWFYRCRHDLFSQCGFTHLAWPNDGYHRKEGQRILNFAKYSSGNHLLIWLI